MSSRKTEPSLPMRSSLFCAFHCTTKNKCVPSILSTFALTVLILCGGMYFNAEGCMRLSLGCSQPLFVRGKLQLNFRASNSLCIVVYRCLAEDSDSGLKLQRIGLFVDHDFLGHIVVEFICFLDILKLLHDFVRFL